MTPEQREAIKTREKAATPGPWVQSTHVPNMSTIGSSSGAIADVSLWSFGEPGNPEESLANAEFIAHARTDIPALLEDLEAAEAKNTHISKLLDLSVISLGIYCESRDTFKHENRDLERERNEAREKLAAAEHDLEEWRDYWGSDSPHDSHVMAGTSDPFVRQLGKEQARANTAENRLAASELAIAQVRAAVDKEEHGDECSSHDCFGNGPCDCWKSRIPTGQDSALVEAVREVVVAEIEYGASIIPPAASMQNIAAIDRCQKAHRELVTLAPESWKHEPERDLVAAYDELLDAWNRPPITKL